MKAAALLLALLASGAYAAAKPIPIVLGKAFRLKKGEIAAIPGGRATLRIAKFINSPCPKGAHCIWSGQAVITELTVDGKIVPPSAKDSPYDITVKNSDYKSFAVLIVDAKKHSPD
ncbi:MAG: hypothetical protein ABL955_03795 [Elusimicrobiota bacterium]